MSKKRVFASSAIVGVVAMFALLSPGAQAEEPPPLPIDPTQGESSLLTVVNSIPLNVIDNALDHFPVPYVIVASAGGAAPTIITSNAGQPNNINADLSKATGKGGHDIKVELNTVLTPTHRLELTVDRLGSAPFASNVSVFIGFPFDAFNSEDLDLPADPNLFIGFQTTTSTGAAGGIVPLKETFVLTPDILAGTSHLVSLQMITNSAPNPLRFLAGHFDGTNETGIVNASGIAAHTNPVPNQINVALDFGESPIAEPGTTATSIGVDWTATARTLLTFNYFEDESGVPSLSNPADYGSSLVVDQMPTDEELTLTLDEDAGALTLSHRANSVIDQISFTKRRLDGLDIRGVATDVPTEVDLTLDLDGAAVLDVNANTLDMRVSAEQRGGFLNTSAFFGYDVGYAEAFFGNAPDLTAAFMPDEDRYQVQATNPGESIEQAGLVLDDGPVAVIDGGIDVNGDDVVDTADDDTIADIAVIDGALDIDGDGDIDANDDGDINSSAAGTTAVINGLFDVDDDGDVDSADDGDVTILQLAPSWIDIEPHHIFSLADFGDEGTAAARAVNISTAALDLDAPTVIDGQVDLDNSGTADGDDDGVLGIDLVVIDGRLDIDDDGDVDNSDDSDSTLGHKIIDGRIDFDDDLDVDANDDGPLTVHTYRLATTAASPLQAYARSEPGAALMPDRRIDAVCDVDDIPAGAINFQIVFPPPDINVSYKTDPPTGIDSVNCTGHIDETFFELALSDLPPEFEMDLDPDQHLKLRAEDGTGTPNSDTLGSLVARFCYDPDWDDCNDEAVDPEPPGGLPSTGAIFGNPLHDARARADEIPSFLGEWGAGARNVIDALVDINGDAAVDGNDDGRFGGFAVIDGRVDMNGDGAINGSDDGRYLGKRVIDGLVDTSDDGVGAANDDGVVSGSSNRFDTGVPDATLFLEGMQVDVSTKVGLDPLPVADPSADHYLRLMDLGLDVDNVTPLEQRLAAGAFGVDEVSYSTDDGGRGLALNYKANQDHALIVDLDTDFGGKFFPQYAIDLNLTVDDVPQTWDFFTDMATEVTYEASSGIDDVTLTGTIDDTDDADDANGTNVDGLLQTLPASLRLHLETDSVAVVDGKLNVNGAGGVDGDDDGFFAGFRIIDGLIDINGDGLADANDDGNLLGLPVFDGMIDTNGSGAVDGDDDSAVAGASLRMNAAIDVVSLELTSTNKIVGTDYQLAEFEILDIPAQWNANWGGGRFLVESLDASGNRDPMGSFSARLSTSSDETTNFGKVMPFTLDGPQLSGSVLGNPGDSGGCRINYTPFAQEVDARYYNAAPGIDPSVVFSRLRNLYCDSEEFLAGQDHALARMEDVNGDGSEAEVGFASLQFSGFQHISWIPDANGGQFIFRAPTPGLHPLFMGVELADQFATMNIENIPDEVIVDIDTDEHITYDAFDDTDASIDQIDLYIGPLPMANDENPAGRVVIDFNNNVINTHDFVHMKWNFDFPNGGAFFNSSEQIDLLALVQDGDSRVTGGLGLEDLHLAYGLDLFSFEPTEEVGITVPCPDPPDFLCDITVPSAWELVQFEAGIDNDADAESLTLPIAFNPAKQTLGGFLAVYDRIGGVQQLVNPAPGINPGANEYVPFVTVEGAGFGIAYADAVVSLDPISPNFGCIVFPACISVTIDINIGGAATLDIWSSVDTHETFGVEGVFEIGFDNAADYTENDPFHIFPIGTPRFEFVDGLVLQFDGFHDFTDHVQPFVS